MYLLAQTVDTLLGFAMSYAVFELWKGAEGDEF